ncbi:hypothetical protein BU16DRAFT_539942 [Lophium mytilinum]|uniref:Uncharacterized protein n=1 Tax=Lophium mytilinum TaxID=390894 RepID=A0A6A6QRP9_9PEZI|nr:hypothetical protein BU16DRAFT_539942 [Lophium mytilinum]
MTELWRLLLFSVVDIAKRHRFVRSLSPLVPNLLPGFGWDAGPPAQNGVRGRSQAFGLDPVCVFLTSALSGFLIYNEVTQAVASRSSGAVFASTRVISVGSCAFDSSLLWALLYQATIYNDGYEDLDSQTPRPFDGMENLPADGG